MCLSHFIYTVRPCLIHTCHAAPMPCSDHAVLLKATPQHGCRETACGLAARVRLLPATTRSSTKIVIRSIPILLTTIHTYDYKSGSNTLQKRRSVKTVGLAVRIFPATTRTFTKDTALSEHGRGAACHVWINGTAWQGNGIETAWARHAMCESALTLQFHICMTTRYVSCNIGNVFCCSNSVRTQRVLVLTSRSQLT